MKKRLRYILHISLLCIAVLLSSCVNTLELVAPQGEGRVMSHEGAVADAKAYFDTHFGQNTRSNHQTPTHEAPYVVGNLVPDWESGVTMADNERAYTDFAIQKDYRFFLALEDEEQRICGLELYSRLASVVDFELDGMNQYVATYIPDISFLSCYDYFVEEELLTCEHIDWFTGVVLYTNLWGYHVAAYKYYDGVLVDSSFLNDASKTEEENIADFMRVMKGVALFVAPTSEGTRAIVAEDISGGQIIYYYNDSGELVWSFCQIDGIVATRPTLKPITLIGDDFVDVRTIKNDTIAPIVPSGGGGGSTSSTEEDEEEDDFEKELVEDLFYNTSNLSEEQIKIVGEMLAEIIRDCMGEELYIQLKEAVNNRKFQLSITLNTNETESYFGCYDDFGNDMVINLIVNESNVLLHEMFHAYQYAQTYVGEEENRLDKYNSATLNNEIEGQLAKYLYCKRNEKTLQDELSWQIGFGNPQNIWSDIASLSKYISISNVSYIIHDTSAYWEQYKYIAGIYRQENPDFYKYSTPKNISVTIQNIANLGINCK